MMEAEGILTDLKLYSSVIISLSPGIPKLTSHAKFPQEGREALLLWAHTLD